MMVRIWFRNKWRGLLLVQLLVEPWTGLTIFMSKSNNYTWKQVFDIISSDAMCKGKWILSCVKIQIFLILDNNDQNQNFETGPTILLGEWLLFKACDWYWCVFVNVVGPITVALGMCLILMCMCRCLAE